MTAYNTTTEILPTGALLSLAAALTRYAECHTGARRQWALYLQHWVEQEALDSTVKPL